MTTQQKFHEMLTSRGMFGSQADKVIEEFKAEMVAFMPDYQVTWDRPASEYPDHFYPSAGLLLNQVATKWIDANQPMAWFRPMFANA
jgi:hypothetical protein